MSFWFNSTPWLPSLREKMQRLEEENRWLENALRECENIRINMQKARFVDLTRPQPCTRFKYLATLSWIEKLSEEMDKVEKEMLKLEQITGTDSDEIRDNEFRLAMKLTQIITFCTSWLHYGLGYDEKSRIEVQKRINKENLVQGSIGDDAAFSRWNELSRNTINTKWETKIDRYESILIEIVQMMREQQAEIDKLK